MWHGSRPTRWLRLAGETAAAARARAGGLAAAFVVAAGGDGEQAQAALERFDGASSARLIDLSLRDRRDHVRRRKIFVHAGELHCSRGAVRPSVGGTSPEAARETERQVAHLVLCWPRALSSPRAPSGAPSRRFPAAGGALFISGRSRHVSEPVAGGPIASGRSPAPPGTRACEGTGRGRRILLRLRTPPETPSHRAGLGLYTAGK